MVHVAHGDIVPDNHHCQWYHHGGYQGIRIRIFMSDQDPVMSEHPDPDSKSLLNM